MNSAINTKYKTTFKRVFQIDSTETICFKSTQNLLFKGSLDAQKMTNIH